MPDISLCTDAECPKRLECYRFTAKPGYWQSYFAETPRKGDECGCFWRVEVVEDGAVDAEK